MCITKAHYSVLDAHKSHGHYIICRDINDCAVAECKQADDRDARNCLVSMM